MAVFRARLGGSCQIPCRKPSWETRENPCGFPLRYGRLSGHSGYKAIKNPSQLSLPAFPLRWPGGIFRRWSGLIRPFSLDFVNPLNGFRPHCILWGYRKARHILEPIITVSGFPCCDTTVLLPRGGSSNSLT